MIKKLKKIFLVLIITLLFTSCSIEYYDFSFDDSNYYHNDANLVEESEKKEELKTKINSRNYIDELYNPYFSFLNAEEKQIYYDILEKAKNYYNDFFDLTYKVDVERLKVIFQSVLYDNPELFWVKSYLYYSDNNIADSVILIYYDMYNDNKNDESLSLVLQVKMKNEIALDYVKVEKDEFDKIVDNIVNDANKYDSNLKKEKYVHDLLINKISYDENFRNDQSPYSALVFNKAVCSGYSKAFQVIMKKINIPTYYVVGEGIDSNNKKVSHAWNLVLLDGKYYNVDVTWDDPIDIYKKRNYLEHTYFNVSDKFIEKNHNRVEISTYLPKASASK